MEVREELVDGRPPLAQMIDDGATAKQIKAEIVRRPGVIGKTGVLGQTNLAYAVSENRVDVAKVLLEAGEDPNTFSQQQSPLLFAVSNGNVEMVELLLMHGADPKKPSPPLSTTPYEMREVSGNKRVQQLLEEYVKRAKNP